MILQAANPWMSASDIDKGSRGLPEVSKALDGMKVGIVCLTPENLTAPWILYESGALSKSIDDKSRLWTYLLAGLNSQDVKQPLGMFQWTKADQDDTRILIRSINKAVSDEPVPENVLDHLFDKLWPDLEKKLETMPEPEEVVDTKRSPDEMLAEVLELARAEANRRKKSDSLDAYIPLMNELMPVLSQVVNATKHGVPLSTLLPPQISPRPITGRPPRKVFFVKLQYDDEVKIVDLSDSAVELLTSAVRERPKSGWERLAFVLNWLPHTRIRYVVVIALTAERIPAAFHATVGTDRSTTVGALRYSRPVAAYLRSLSLDVFDLTEWIHVATEYQCSTAIQPAKLCGGGLEFSLKPRLVYASEGQL